MEWHENSMIFSMPIPTNIEPRKRHIFPQSHTHMYVCIYMYIYMKMCHHPRTYPQIWAWHSNELMSLCVIMISSDFWALGVPSAVWVPITALISGRAIVVLDPNLWRRFAYVMNNPNCTPKYHPGSSSLEITSSQELQRQRSNVAPALGHARVVEMFHDVSEILTEKFGEFSRHVWWHLPYTKKWHRRA